MKKSEMSAEQLEDRRIFREHLADAGWDVEDWTEALDAGASVEPEAEAEHAGPVFNLRLEYHAKHRFVALGIVHHDGESLLRLRLHPSGELAPLLAKATAMQDTLDAENYPDLVKSLIPLAASLLIETDEGLFQLSE